MTSHSGRRILISASSFIIRPWFFCYDPLDCWPDAGVALRDLVVLPSTTLLSSPNQIESTGLTTAPSSTAATCSHWTHKENTCNSLPPSCRPLRDSCRCRWIRDRPLVPRPDCPGSFISCLQASNPTTTLFPKHFSAAEPFLQSVLGFWVMDRLRYVFYTSPSLSCAQLLAAPTKATATSPDWIGILFRSWLLSS